MPRQRTENGQEAGTRGTGSVVEIKGVVIDAVFTGSLPAINNALERSRQLGQERMSSLLPPGMIPPGTIPGL